MSILNQSTEADTKDTAPQEPTVYVATEENDAAVM
jgi:hypothetical protein